MFRVWMIPTLSPLAQRSLLMPITVCKSLGTRSACNERAHGLGHMACNLASLSLEACRLQLAHIMLTVFFIPCEAFGQVSYHNLCAQRQGIPKPRKKIRQHHLAPIALLHCPCAVCSAFISNAPSMLQASHPPVPLGAAPLPLPCAPAPLPPQTELHPAEQNFR